MKRFFISAAVLSIAVTSVAATWVDSTGTAVVDGDAQTRPDRGTATGGSASVGIDVEAISVMSRETSQALADLADLIGDDGKLVAQCSTGSVSTTVIECPSYANSSCQSAPNTGLRQLTSSLNNTYDLWWGDGQRDLDNKTHLTFRGGSTKYSPIHRDTMPPLSHVKLQSRTITVPSRNIEITLSQQGYDVSFDGEKVSDQPTGDISLFSNTRLTNLSNRADISSLVAHYPTLIFPQYRFRYYYYTSANSCGSKGCTTKTELKNDTLVTYISNKYNRISGFRMGVNNAYPTGKLNNTVAIRNVEHIASGGKYTTTIRLDLELAAVRRDNSYYTYYQGYRRTGALLEYWADKAKGSNDFDLLVDSYSYSGGTAPKPQGSDIVRPFLKTVICTLQ